MDKSDPEEWNPLSDILFVRNSFDEKWSRIPWGEKISASKYDSSHVTNLPVVKFISGCYSRPYDFLYRVITAYSVYFVS